MDRNESEWVKRGSIELSFYFIENNFELKIKQKNLIVVQEFGGRWEVEMF